MKLVSLWLMIAFFTTHSCYAGDTAKNDLVSFDITYKTSKAAEVYICWSLEYWNLAPEPKYWPNNTVIQDKMAKTKMIRNNDSFSIRISLPKKSYISYMFWVPVDVDSDSTDGWDTYGELFYASTFDRNSKVTINDNALWMPEKKSKFKTLESGLIILSVSIVLCAVLLLFNRKKLRFSAGSVYTGLLLAFLFLSCLIRMEMNNLGSKTYLIFGAIFHDLVFLLIISSVFYLLAYFLRNIRIWRVILFIVFGSFLFACTLFSVLNIEIVEQLGRPLNYQWLYYSDFMRGTDAKNAIAYKASKGVITNMWLISVAILAFTFGFSLSNIKLNRLLRYALVGFGLLIISMSYFQFETKKFTPAKVMNPVTELSRSIIQINDKPKLFSMDISKDVQLKIKNYHSGKYLDKLDTSNTINNIILFVLESTPKHYISLYDSTLNVTPNLKKWKHISTVFTNMYSHIPSTSNAMATMISGMYPMISFKSIISEYEAKLPSITAELIKQNWRASFFSSADLTFGSMEDYAEKYGFEEILDSKTMSCDYPRFNVTNTLLDGLDDRCITEQYFKWKDSLNPKKTFSLIWTNQTHYPYFINEDVEKNYVSGNPEFNRYLNGLESSDEAFGKLLEGLEARNLLQSTLIIVVGDHGEAFGTHNQTGHGRLIYEENVNVPCIIYNPMLGKGEINNNIAGLIDIPPTIAHIIGLQKDEKWQGKSLFALNDQSRTFFICPYSDFLFGTRYAEWKYIYNATLNKEELYNLNSDPKELNNLSKKFQDICKREYELLGGWVQYHNERLKALRN